MDISCLEFCSRQDLILKEFDVVGNLRPNSRSFEDLDVDDQDLND
jgi:hypothetical protein